MRRKSFSSWPCSIARTVDLLGDAWTLLVLRELFYGQSRFDGFVSSLGIARNTLTDRLALLVEGELVQRHEYQQDPVRYDYLLTEKGKDLFGVLAAINAWGDRWLSTEAGPPVVMRHETCGHDFSARVTCSECYEDVRLDDVTVRVGSGFPARLLEDEAVRARFDRAGLPGAERTAAGNG